jgi:hypothetical protein
MIDALPEYITLSEEHLAANESRKDTKLSQIVRNLKSHKTSKSNLIYQGYAEDVRGGFRRSACRPSVIARDQIVTRGLVIACRLPGLLRCSSHALMHPRARGVERRPDQFDIGDAVPQGDIGGVIAASQGQAPISNVPRRRSRHRQCDGMRLGPVRFVRDCRPDLQNGFRRYMNICSRYTERLFMNQRREV